MTITHEACQSALAEGRPYDERVDEHAATCDTCAAFARGLDRLEAAAAGFATARAPEALAERIVHAVAAAPGRTGAGAQSKRLPRALLLRSAIAAAAAVAVVLGSVAVLDARDPDPERMVLIAAARDLEEGGSARVDVEASAEFTAGVGADRRPRYEDVPPEVRGYLEVEWERMMAELDRQIAELEGRIDEMLSESERQMNEAFEGTFGGGGSTGPTRAPRQPAARPGQSPAGAPAEPRQPPPVASVGVRVVAGGATDFGGSAAFEGTVTPVSGTVEAPPAAVPFGVAVAGSAEARAVRGPDGAWATVTTDAQAPLASVLLDSRALPSLLRSAEGDVETAADGRYRFVAAHGGQRWRAEATIDDGGRVRRVTLTPVTRSLPDVAALSIRLEVGAAGALEPGAARTQATAAVSSTAGPAPDAGGAAVFPLGASVRSAFAVRQR